MGSSEDLLSQRNKLQQQILDLETALGADQSIIDLLSSSSSSDEESDDCEHAGEEAVPKDLEAKRQKIQREIEALEQTLGADAALVAGLTDSEHGTGSHMDSSDENSDEDLELPQDVETCLQMNLVYQEVLKEKLADLERLLNENRQQQKETEAQLSGPVSASPGLTHTKLFLGTFMKPYFKDKLTGLGPPANEETKEKLSHGTRPCDEMKIRRWEGWQKTLLLNSVVSDTMRRMLQPKMSKLDYLTAKLSKAKGVQKEELEKQIALLEKDIEEISSLSEDQLYGNRHDDHDWDKIANTDFEGLRTADDLKWFWQNYLHPYINKSTWKEDEVEKLSAIVEQFKCSHWDQIAEALGTNRTAFMCFQTYQRYIAKSFRKREWSKEEDQILRDLVEKMRIGNFIPYVQLSYFMEGRDSAQIMYRWTSVLDPSIKKGPWSKEEDELLRKAVEKYGLKDWWKIRLEVPGRTDNACRDRYLDCLRDDVKRGTWSDDEVELLKKLVEKYGVGKWAKIASEIPNRIDSQCLNKWKWMTRCAAKQGEKRKPKSSTKPESKSKRRKKKMKVEEESEISEKDSTSEDEKIKVEYMDSDEEQKKVNIPCEKDTDFREEYIQPDIKEWIPVDWKANMNREEIVRTILVRLPTEGDCDPESCYRLMRCTMLNRHGFPVKTYMIREPVVLNKWDLCNEKAMILVRTNEVKHLLTWMRASAVKGIAKRISNMLSTKRQNRAKRDEQVSSGQPRSGQTIQCTQTTHTSKSIINSNLEYSLLMAVIPWIGNVLLPPPFYEKKLCEADAARTRAADVPLPKTAVFVLFLKVLHIDAEGCKKVIEAQKYEPRPQPVRLSSSVTVKTVAKLLAEKKEREARKLADPKQPPATHQTPSQPVPPGPQQTSPISKAPQASVITQPKKQQGVLPLQPAEPGIVHLLQSSAQATSKTVQPVLQLVAQVTPGKSAQPATPPTTSISSPSSTVPLTENAHKARASTRKCKPTLKAQALKETKASKKTSAKNKPGSGGTRTVAVLPQTTAWILTSAGLMPVQLPPQGIVGNQKQVMPSSVPQVLLQPPAKVNQNGPARGPSDTTEVTSSTAGISPNQSLTPSSISLVPSNTSNVPIAVTVSALRGKTPERQCYQKQNLSNVVPQVPIQSPIILSQSASHVVLSNAVPPTVPSKYSPTAVANPAGPSQNFTSSNAAKVSSAPSVGNVVHVSSASAVPSAPALAFISSPVVQMPSSAVLGKQKQRMSNSASRVVLSQPVIVNQNGSLTLVSAAGPHLPILTSPSIPMANISEVPSSPAASSAPSVNNGPAVHTVSLATVAGSDISTVPTSHAIPTPGQILPKNVVQQTSLETNKQPLPTASSTSNPSPSPGFLSYDPNLMFLEHPDQVKNWITGNGGISLPQLHDKMPYLPPFVSSITTLVSLLKAKESLLRGAMQLLPEEERANSDKETKITAIRKLVSDRFRTNPAYSLLKARFLSCFTLPALLATIHPCKESRLPGSDLLDGDEDEDNKDEVEVMLGENEDQSAVHLLNTKTNEAAATQFSGMSPRN